MQKYKKKYLQISKLTLAILALGLSMLSYAEKNEENIMAEQQKYIPENTLVIELKDGKVYIELFEDKAPNHVARIKDLSSEGFYDGIVFHRVISGFMAQTGDPTGTGMGGSNKPDLKAEFNDAKHVRGTVSMARSMNPHSANSQFFICFEAAPHLDGEYTVWGQVVEGMEYIDNIKKGDSYSGEVKDPDKMIKVRLLKDMQ